MAKATIAITLPTTRTDGSAFAAGDYGGAHIFRDGAQIGTVTAPGLTYADPTDIAPGSTVTYTATVFDTQTIPTESDLSPAVPVQIPAAPVAPSPPTISVTVA